MRKKNPIPSVTTKRIVSSSDTLKPGDLLSLIPTDGKRSNAVVMVVGLTDTPTKSRECVVLSGLNFGHKDFFFLDRLQKVEREVTIRQELTNEKRK